MSNYLIPESWTTPMVAVALRCSLDEADAFIRDHQDDEGGLLGAIELECLRQDLQQLRALREAA